MRCLPPKSLIKLFGFRLTRDFIHYQQKQIIQGKHKKSYVTNRDKQACKDIIFIITKPCLVKFDMDGINHSRTKMVLSKQ